MATASSQTSSSSSHSLTIVGAVLGIVGAILVTIILYTTYRMKRNKDSDDVTSPLPGISLPQHHPAAQITPFGSPGGETPRFRHTPGSDMRIAIRRPDGAWQFSRPHDPFAPYGVSEIDILPSPLSSTVTLPSPVKTKGGDSKSLQNLHSHYDHHYEFDLCPPPPAYGYDYSGHIPPFKN